MGEIRTCLCANGNDPVKRKGNDIKEKKELLYLSN